MRGSRTDIIAARAEKLREFAQSVAAKRADFNAEVAEYAEKRTVRLVERLYSPTDMNGPTLEPQGAEESQEKQRGKGKSEEKGKERATA
jgi:hypothetical protein